jgi:PAP2 superfamily
MKSEARLFVLVVFLPCAQPSAQVPDSHLDSVSIDRVAVSSTSRKWQKALKAPVILGAVSLFSLTDNDLLSKEGVYDRRNKYLPKFQSRADDYLQYAPSAVVFGLDAFGVKAKHDLKNRCVLLMKTELVVGLLTFSLKQLTSVPRPDNASRTSFPSGHTAQVFATAVLLSKEYGDRSLWYSIGAYTVATSVGIMRIMNNRHWVSDVLAGAGVGILSANLCYITHQFQWNQKGKRGVRREILLPATSRGSYGLTFICQL